MRVMRPYERLGGVWGRRPEDFGPVPLEVLDEFFRMRECGKVASRHLVGPDAQALLHDSTLEVSREEAVVAAQQEASRYFRPALERPRIPERSR